MSKNKSKSVASTSGVVVSDAPSLFSPLKKLRNLKFATAAVLVLVILAGGWVLHNGVTKQKDSSKAVPSGTKVVTYNDQLVNELNDAKAKVSQNEASQDVSNKQKALDYSALARAYENSNQPAEAIKAYQKALTTDPEHKSQILNGLMYAYAANGQRQEAIAAGEELLGILKAQQSADSISHDSYVSSVTNSVNALKAGKNL
jgi:tetratricopeptide (TPR) repeat protein